MNRRIIYAFALVAFGLLVGILIGRFLLPDRYGLVTMILLLAVGMVVGALGVQAWHLRRGEPIAPTEAAPQPLHFTLLGRGVTVRLDPEWLAKFRARWLGVETNRRYGIKSFWDAHWAEIEVPNAVVVVGVLLLGVVAQILILGSLLTAGLALYAVAGIILIVWLWRQRLSLFHLISAARIGRRVEFLLLILILLVAFATRMIEVGAQPVGIDGDELKWTAQIYYDFISNEKTGDFSGQQKWTPVSFFVDKVAFDTFGVDFNSPRIMTALLSVLATFVFYFVARDMFNVPVALVSTLLMATSYYDVNTSRQAIVETFTKLPMILALFLVIRGVDRQRWFYFVLCGVVLYLGIMTYDTFFVLPPVILIYIVFRGALDWKRLPRWVFYLALTVAPMLLAYPIVSETVAGRQYTYVKGVSTGVSDLVNENTIRPIIDNTLKSFAALYQILQGADYALDWQGALLNPIVLILFTLGFALVLARFWQRHNLLLILSFVVCWFPAPILSGYTVPRVFYIGLPPIFIFAGVFVAALAAAIISLGKQRVAIVRAVTVGVSLLLVVIAVTDTYILTTQLTNRDDWLKRRSLVQAVQTSIRTAPFTLIPITRSQDDYVWGNTGVLKFIAYTGNPTKKIADRFRVLTYAELPGALGQLGSKYENVNVLYDKDLARSDKIAASTIDTLKRCYGDIQATTGDFFDIYSLDKTALDAPSCYSLTSLQGTTPGAGQSVPADKPLTFAWSSESKRPTAFHLQVEARAGKLVWLEGESFPHDGDWAFEAKADYYPGFSGSGYILDSIRSGPTTMSADIPADGTYRVWVRSVRNTKEGHQSFLSVGDQKFEFARADVPLGTWNWEMIGQADLKQGPVNLTLSRVYGKEGWKPILIDALFLSADPNFDPNQDELWAQKVDTGNIPSSATNYVLQDGLPAGTYRWRVQLLDGAKLVDASGKRGVWSDKIEFQVQNP